MKKKRKADKEDSNSGLRNLVIIFLLFFFVAIFLKVVFF
jgi:hypothetical protein